MHGLIACIGFETCVSAVIPASFASTISGSAGAFLSLFFSVSASLQFSAVAQIAASKYTPGFLTAIGDQIGPVAATGLAIVLLCISILLGLQFFFGAFLHPSFRHRVKSHSMAKMRAIRACTALASYASMMQLCIAQQVSPWCRHVSKCHCEC
jgi:hypothetical protein